MAAKIKKIIHGAFFLVLFSCAGTYLFKSNNGFRTYYTLKQDFNQEKEHVEKLELKINTIKQDIKNWQTDTLEKERIARQDLGMSFTNELVYLMPTKKTL